MPDLYAQITEIPDETVAILADAMETRAQDSEMVDMRRCYFDWLDLASGAHVIEIGSGPGDISRDLVDRPEVESVVGLDPSAFMVSSAQVAIR